MPDDRSMAEWIASTPTDDLMTILSAALRLRDWRGVEGAMKLLALKDPELAKTVYDTMLAATAAGGGTDGEW